VDAVLFGVLAGGVQEYLQGVVGTTQDQRRGGAGPGEAPRLAAAWRALLRQHELGADGHCQTCGRGRWTTRSGLARSSFAKSSLGRSGLVRSDSASPSLGRSSLAGSGSARSDLAHSDLVDSVPSREPPFRAPDSVRPSHGRAGSDQPAVDGPVTDAGKSGGDPASPDCTPDRVPDCTSDCAPGCSSDCAADCAAGDSSGCSSGWWPSWLSSGWLGWWPVRRRSGLCTVWQVAVAYFIRRLPNGER
jgi:hypothetical protein